MLTNATISCGNIGEGAFYSCINLTSITFGAAVESIGDNAFHTCNSLSDVYMTNVEVWLKIRFAEKEWTPLDDFYSTLNIVDDDGNEVTKVEIPNTIAEINEHAFYNCKNLKSVAIPNSVTEIGDYAFYNCDSLTSITIPDRVTSN